MTDKKHSLWFCSVSELGRDKGGYCEIYPLLEGNIEEFNLSIPLLRIIFFTVLEYSEIGRAACARVTLMTPVVRVTIYWASSLYREQSESTVYMEQSTVYSNKVYTVDSTLNSLYCTGHHVQFSVIHVYLKKKKKVYIRHLIVHSEKEPNWL